MRRESCRSKKIAKENAYASHIWECELLTLAAAMPAQEAAAQGPLDGASISGTTACDILARNEEITPSKAQLRQLDNDALPRCVSPVLALNGHANSTAQWLLSGVKRTWQLKMSAYDPKRTSPP
jgi:hypothetical protein